MKLEPHKACLMIVCAAMLNNIATQRRLPILYLPEDIEAAAVADAVYPEQLPPLPLQALQGNVDGVGGLAVRQNNVDQYF